MFRRPLPKPIPPSEHGLVSSREAANQRPCHTRQPHVPGEMAWSSEGTGEKDEKAGRTADRWGVPRCSPGVTELGMVLSPIRRGM